jgi:alpha-glucosidase
MSRRSAITLVLFVALGRASGSRGAEGERTSASVRSPNGRNEIALLASSEATADDVQYLVSRDGREVVSPSRLGLRLAGLDSLARGARVVDVQTSDVNERFDLPWGKTKTVVHNSRSALVTLTSPAGVNWQVELRAANDGVAFRCRVLPPDRLPSVEVVGEDVQFDVAGEAEALFTVLPGFVSSHEATYERRPLAGLPVEQLFDMPLLVTWPDGQAAAITEARVRNFAGMYLVRESADRVLLSGRLAPRLDRPTACVVGAAPMESPWRVVLLADSAGKLHESNLLLSLNEPPSRDYAWVRPGKTTFHWWNGDFEDDHKLAGETRAFVDRHKAYIDFCARHHIAYHGLSGDGHSWYPQSSVNYGAPSDDADVRVARPELALPEILAYARERGVGVRLWVHWKALDQHLEEAFTAYEEWGVAGLMVDFLDRDDQRMLDFSERVLESAARHRLNIQFHGSSKPSGEQRTFPHLFNREGALNMEYDKWTALCTPQHCVNVAYARALAGPVDFHLGGFDAAPTSTFEPRDRPPRVMGSRCHQLALYVVYENPLPMVADRPSNYENEPGFEFIELVPVTWDETRFVAGEVGQYIVLARRRGDEWYLGGINNATARDVELPLSFLPPGEIDAQLYVDGSLDDSQPNELRVEHRSLAGDAKLAVSLASGGGFAAVLRPR